MREIISNHRELTIIPIMKLFIIDLDPFEINLFYEEIIWHVREIDLSYLEQQSGSQPEDIFIKPKIS